MIMLPGYHPQAAFKTVSAYHVTWLSPPGGLQDGLRIIGQGDAQPHAAAGVTYLSPTVRVTSLFTDQPIYLLAYLLTNPQDFFQCLNAYVPQARLREMHATARRHARLSAANAAEAIRAILTLALAPGPDPGSHPEPEPDLHPP